MLARCAHITLTRRLPAAPPPLPPSKVLSPPLTTKQCFLPRCQTGNGGGLYIATNSAVTLEDCNVYACIAGYKGGGLYMLGLGATVLRGSIFENQALRVSAAQNAHAPRPILWTSASHSRARAVACTWGVRVQRRTCASAPSTATQLLNPLPSALAVACTFIMVGQR